VIIADVVMSIDNVLGVAAAAKGSLLLLVFGLVVSVPLVIGGAQIIMRLIERFPILIVAGGGLLGYVAGELIVEDSAITDWVHVHARWLAWVAPISGVVLVVGASKLLQSRQRKGATD
jgi:predicted tellurium resistance membrane protein TerC